MSVVLLRITDSDYPFGIFKLFLMNENVRKKTEGTIMNGQSRDFSTKMMSNMDPP